MNYAGELIDRIDREKTTVVGPALEITGRTDRHGFE